MKKNGLLLGSVVIILLLVFSIHPVGKECIPRRNKSYAPISFRNFSSLTIL